MNNNNVKNYKTFLYWDDQNKLTKKSNSKKIIKLGIHTILVFILKQYQLKIYLIFRLKGKKLSITDFRNKLLTRSLKVAKNI